MDFQTQVEEIISTAKFGDLIEFAYPIGYSHWGVYDEDGYVIHFAVADEKKLMSNIRTYLQKIFPVCGDLLLGETRIRRVLLGEVNVPKGAIVSIGNDHHSLTPSTSEHIRLRRDALLDRDFQYKLFTLNCEHFATFVRYGKAVCNQCVGELWWPSGNAKLQMAMSRASLSVLGFCTIRLRYMVDSEEKIPARVKNKECEVATAFFNNVVSPNVTVQDDTTVQDQLNESSDFFKSNVW